MSLSTKLLWLLLSSLLCLVAVGFVHTGATGFKGVGQEEVSEEILLPDLKTLPPEDFRIESNSEENTKSLRFSNTVWNAGRGPLEVRGESNKETGKTRVTQVLYSEDGPVEEHEVGEFVSHPDHNHWHMEEFALYELRSLTPEGEVGSIVASSSKVSYCITESTRVDGELISDGEQREYRGCGDELQGSSPGRGDTYGSSVSGQELNIETVPDGEYALRSVADPENRLTESDDGNNETIVYLKIDDEVSELEKP